MSRTKEIIGKIQTILSGITGVTVADGLYPDAIVNEVGNRYPAIILKMYDSEFPDISNAGQTYIEERSIGIMIYVDSNGIDDTALKLAEIEDEVISSLAGNANLGIYEGYVFVNGVKAGEKYDGQSDLYNVGFYEDCAVSEVMTTINYRRC